MDRIGEVDVAIVLGSGLSEVLSDAGFDRIPYADLDMPIASLAGHPGHALVGRMHGKRVLAFAGRVHLYQGFSARDVTRNITVAADRGARTVLLTNAAGGLNPALRPGDLMTISDHINLTGTSPIVGSGASNPFVNMTHAYSERLREFARALDEDLEEGVYASVIGPAYETPAEAHYLRTIGADAVGMSTVLETIAARARNMDVFGVSMITNVVASAETSHDDVTDVAAKSAPRLFALIQGLVERI